MSIFKSSVEVHDPIGLHARPASQIVKLVKESGVTVMLGRAGQSLVKANSPLMLMAMKIKTGETLDVTVESEDEAFSADLVAQIQDLLKG